MRLLCDVFSLHVANKVLETRHLARAVPGVQLGVVGHVSEELAWGRGRKQLGRETLEQLNRSNFINGC